MNSDEDVCYDMIKILIEGGANPHFKDHNEQTVMFYLSKDGKRKPIQYLLQAGCKLDEVDRFGQTPIFYAAS